MIVLKDVEFSYPGSDFRLQVPEMIVSPGATVALIGPSGSGKTTILNLIAGILVPSSGLISTNAVNLSACGDSARRAFRVQNIGLVFQEFALLEHLSVLDNILLPCRITSAIQLRQAHRDRAAELARDVGLADKLRRYVCKLSQGERQRVAICRALLLEPPLLLCDEPTGNLDPANKTQVLKILFDYVSCHNTTLLTVTHDYELLPHFDETIDCRRFHASSEATA
ncbi:MAG TPA: ATP-binding cassette domain-containing protein [Pirellulaceae bacterium]|nr:ATP-binding cassette domain-containing protein [Pirellulaceae bacterium]